MGNLHSASSYCSNRPKVSTTSNNAETDQPSSQPVGLTNSNGASKHRDTGRASASPSKQSRQSPRGWTFRNIRKSSRQKAQSEKSEGEEDGGQQSPLAIRQLQLQQMQEERPQLTQSQLQLLAETWKVLQLHSEDVGRDMFVRLFETYPDVKGAFGPFKSLSPDDIRFSQELRAHGQRVLTTIDKMMSTRDDTSSMVTHLHELGQRHVTYSVKVDYIDIVGQQFLFAIEPVLKEEWTPEVEQAWADLFRFISHVMREAMML